MKHNKILLAFGLISIAVTTGCSDSDSSSNQSSSDPVPYNVTAIDGYLQNAQVWLDLNNNYLLDDGEPNAFSGTGGVAELNVSGIADPTQYPIVVQAIAGQTIDEDQGPVTEAYVMSAPAGETAVTPLSTVVHNALKQDPTLDKDTAVQQVATQLGIKADDVLGDFIDGGASKAAYAAEQIVEQGALPTDPEELQKVSQPGSSEAGKFTIIVAGVNEEIKQVLDTVDDSQTSEEIKQELDEKEPIVIEDRDGDGVKDIDDEYPDNADEWVDADNDGLGDNKADPHPNDTDNDGYNNDIDQFPTNSDEWADNDNDGLGDNQEDEYPNDTDNDGYTNDNDEYPNDNTRIGDGDNDGIDDLTDQYPNDTDNDGYTNDDDEFPNDNTRSGDSDNDGYDNLDDDYPNDDTRSGDSDNDSIDNNIDNCPTVANNDQADSDLDGIGDACDINTEFTWDNTNWDESNWQ
ncbi:hypothetical protein [Vibrio maerlii]|uniref:hypothetical protein n=1 Tax=Vibrio maerlii TaxID=2231648 RepID=UPI000E3EB2D7|nr:hypothetical protein [Vibrio maerlii]